MTSRRSVNPTLDRRAHMNESTGRREREGERGIIYDPLQIFSFLLFDCI
jgi:hypothetical protein